MLPAHKWRHLNCICAHASCNRETTKGLLCLCFLHSLKEYSLFFIKNNKIKKIEAKKAEEKTIITYFINF